MVAYTGFLGQHRESVGLCETKTGNPQITQITQKQREGAKRRPGNDLEYRRFPASNLCNLRNLWILLTLVLSTRCLGVGGTCCTAERPSTLQNGGSSVDRGKHHQNVAPGSKRKARCRSSFGALAQPAL